MRYLQLVILFSLVYSKSTFAQNKTTTETLSVKRYDNLNNSLPADIISKTKSASFNESQYKSYLAKNNADISIKYKKKEMENNELSSTTYENEFATNSTSLAAPSEKNTVYELLSKNDRKEYFPEIAFLDNQTIVTIGYGKRNATLLFIDISNSQMHVTSKLNIPVNNFYKANSPNTKELFYIDSATKSIIIPVNKQKAIVSKTGELSWKKGKTSTPGIWIIQPVKNDEKRWSFDGSTIQVNYFYSENFSTKRKKALIIQTAHADNAGNIWMNFNKGIIGVLANQPIKGKAFYSDDIKLHNFNLDYSWYNNMKKDYATLLFDNLKNTISNEDDSTNLKNSCLKTPQAYSSQYLEQAKYAVFSTILRDKNNALDSNAYFENSESLKPLVQIDLDDPTTKRKNKKVDYFNYKISQFQMLQNDITTGNDGAVYVTTNLGLHKLSFNPKTNSIQVKWSLPYKNSFIKEIGYKTASSQTTPVFIEEKNEVVFCDNDFPTKNLLIIDGTTGNIKAQFPLFEYAAGSACDNAVSYFDNTIFVSNTFGNGAYAYPAKGIMKFNCTMSGAWQKDIDWNKLHVNTLCNTAALKVSATDKQAYIYQNDSTGLKWEFSSITLDKATDYNKIKYSLSPNFDGVLKVNLNNQKSNFTFGPNHTMFIGTSNGLLKIMSE